ncbi:MAG: hypothetical protein EAZ44_08535 [Cytophagia bacterium]|nr:MAG: hypothetical protein EAZ44_08535 [Cytophagia bacterium]TAG40549.1 MAG: hypothetical protein EAZ31_08255 [Cytophagia bacterium]
MSFERSEKSNSFVHKKLFNGKVASLRSAGQKITFVAAPKIFWKIFFQKIFLFFSQKSKTN